MTYALSPSAKALVAAYDDFLKKKARIERFAPLLDLTTRLLGEIAGDRHHRASVSEWSEYIYVHLSFKPDDSMALVLSFIEGMGEAGYAYVTDKVDAENNTRDLTFFSSPAKTTADPHVMFVIHLGDSKNCVRKVVGYRTVPAKVEPERQEPIYEIECLEGADMQEAAE